MTVRRVHGKRFGYVLALTLFGASPTARALEPFYLTPVPDEATTIGAKREGDPRVYPFYTESHALLIGEARYTTFDPLPGVRTEVGRLADVLHLHHFKVEVHFDLTAAQMTQVVDEFMRKRATVKDARILVYVSGHGVSYPTVRRFGYLVPVDAPAESSGRQMMSASSMPMQIFAAWAQIPEARHMLFVFDACFSGSFFGRPDGPAPPLPFGSPSTQLGSATSRPSTPISDELPSSRGIEVSDYVFGDYPRSLGRQFLTAGGASETVPTSSVFTDLFIRILQGPLTAKVNSNFDNWTTGRELGNWIESKARDYYEHPAAAPGPIFGSLNDSLFASGDIVFTRLDYPNPYLVMDSTTRWPEPGTVQKKVAEFVLAETAQVPEVRTAYLTALDTSRAAAQARAAVRVSISPPLAGDPPPQSPEGQLMILESRAAQASRDLRQRILTAKPENETVETQSVLANSAFSEIEAVNRRTAVVPPADGIRILSAEEEKSLQSIVNDFTSTDMKTRRGARPRMSDFLAALPPPKAVTATTRLLQDLKLKSYRFQLGMAVALASLPKSVAAEAAPAARTELKAALAAPTGRDPTLKSNLKGALDKLPRA